ncbi:MAG: adenylyltransferase/cytidyltransferase family protein [Pyrinomonadaceae bacterium]
MSNYFAPIIDSENIATFINKMRSPGSKIVLANGCFDVFHVGHVRYLFGAKELGDVLVVAINSDRQTRVLKGKGRPLVPQNERAEIISSLRCVDVVTIFDDPTVEKLIRSIRPDFHAKGTDYTAWTVPERNVALEYGARVAIVGDPKDHSSTRLIDDITESN